jgi:hypothetical protein
MHGSDWEHNGGTGRLILRLSLEKWAVQVDPDMALNKKGRAQPRFSREREDHAPAKTERCFRMKGNPQ